MASSAVTKMVVTTVYAKRPKWLSWWVETVGDMVA